MILRIWRALLAAGLGAGAGALCVTAAYVWHPALVVEMDRELPRPIASGFYPVERAGETTFAWTSARADITLKGLRRTSPWECDVALRGGRSDPATQPAVDVAVDGISAANTTATNDFRVLRVPIPTRSGAGATLSINASRTIIPGPADTRQLGVQVDRFSCQPANALAFPPGRIVRDAAAAAAIFGAAIALGGAGLFMTTLAAFALAAVQAFPLASGPAPYTGFSAHAVWLGAWIAAASLISIVLLERWRGASLENAARFVVFFSGAALYLKLLGLLHPSKLLVDALFHAHRLEWVMAGRYYFTQPMPGGVSFPYAIGLYVFAAPWAAVTRDHVALLRVVVCTAEVVAGALLYPLMAAAWRNRVAAAAAIVLFNVVPLPYGLVGNANLTNAFGQSVALATLIAVSMMPRRPGTIAPVAALFALCALAFLSHVSTFALLGVTLMALTFFYRWNGGLPLSRTAWTILGVTVAAGVFAFVLYYGHFADVYRTALRVRSTTAAAPAAVPTSEPASPAAAGVPFVGRVANALEFTVAAVGWPILILAALGIWRIWSERLSDRAAYLVAAWGVAYLAFLGLAVMRVDAPFQRYAAEFFGRVLLATYPAAVVLAGCGIGWAWRHGAALRILSLALVGSAVILGLQHWSGWFI